MTKKPSPKMSPSSMMMSPTLMPMRNSMRRPAGAAALGDHLPLQLNGTAHRVNDAGELDQEPIAGGLDDAAAVLGDLRVAELASDRPQCGEGTLLVRFRQPRVAGDIGRQDRREPTFDTGLPSSLHGASSVAAILHEPTLPRISSPPALPTPRHETGSHGVIG